MGAAMRIVHLLKHCDRGNGHVHVAVDLACAQASAGHDVCLASGGGTYSDLLAANGVALADIPQGGRRALTAGLPRLAGKVRSERVDVVHAHMMGSAVIGYVATRGTDAALVTTMHNSFDRHSGLMRLGDVVVAVSGAEARDLVSRGFDPGRVRTVPNGPLDSPRWALPVGVPECIPVPCVMTVSGLHRRKRVHDVVDAFAAVAAACPGWTLVVVGSGPDEAMLKTRAAEVLPPGRVVFTGSALNPMPLLRRASVFVNMAEAEPFGLVVAEARSAGCAVVVSKAGGMPEVAGGGAIVLPVGDVGALSETLSGLMRDPDFLAARRAATALPAGLYGVGAMAAAYDKVYADAVGARAGGIVPFLRRGSPSLRGRGQHRRAARLD